MLIKKTKEMTDSERLAVENSNNQYLKALSYAPVGMIIPFAGSVAPDTFLFCDGAELNVDEYADLFSVIGYSYGGSGDIFNLPDLRGKTIVGVDSTDENFNELGKTGGQKNHTHSLSQAYARIGRTISGNTGDIAWKSSDYGYGSGAGLRTYTTPGVEAEENQIHPTALGGTTDSGDNIQPYVATNFIIKSMNAISKDVEITVQIQADQTYNPESTNAQSGVAVAQAVNDRIPKPTYSPSPLLSVVTVNRDSATYDPLDNSKRVIKDTAFGAKYIDDPTVDGKSAVIYYGGYLVQRDSVGNLWTGEPVDDQDCVPYSMYKALLERVEALEVKT